MKDDASAARLLYVTAPDNDVARTIGAALVEARLAACVNILPGMISLYRWNGAVEQGQEVVLIVKTTRARADAATAAIVAMHPYEVPCVIAFDPTGGHQPFLDWIAAEAGGAGVSALS